MTIITGASSNHFSCLLNLLGSIRCCEPDMSVIVYDLGLNEQEKSIVKGAFHLRTFDFSLYPPWVDIRVDRGHYAWKPIIISDALDEFGGIVLWLDAGDLLLRPLQGLREAIERNGVVTPISPRRIKDWTHPGTLRFLNVAESDYEKKNRNGAIVGFDQRIKWASDLAHRWKQCALIKECIAPEGSSRKNHRQDQAVLSILYYQYQEVYGFEMTDLVPEVSRHNDSLSADKLSRYYKGYHAGEV
jgi:hypothetical protein